MPNQSMTDPEIIESVLADADARMADDPDISFATAEATLTATRRLMEFVQFDYVGELSDEEDRQVSELLAMYVNFYALTLGALGGSTSDYAERCVHIALTGYAVTDLGDSARILCDDVYYVTEERGTYPDEYHARLEAALGL